MISAHHSHPAATEGGRGHARAFLISSLVTVALVVHAKGGIDLFVPAAAVWAGMGIAAMRWVRGPAAFVVTNVALLAADAGLDVLAMGQHLPAGTPGIVPWQFGDGQGWVVAYWVALWGFSMPQRTLGILRRTSHGRMTGGLLLLAVIGLHVGFVEDVLYFAFLGFPPWAGPPPLAYAYLPTLPGFGPWTVDAVWAVSSVAATFFLAVSAAAVLLPSPAHARRRSAHD